MTLLENINRLMDEMSTESHYLEERGVMKKALQTIKQIFRRTKTNEKMSTSDINSRNRAIHVSVRSLKREYNKPAPVQNGDRHNNALRILRLIKDIFPNH
jgi:hypothetical protein